MRHLYASLFAFVVLTAACGEDGGTTLVEPADLLPGDGEISGWSWDGIPAEATDQSSLYDLIDGGAEEFVEQGFVSGVLHRYRGILASTATTLEVFIADQGSLANAKSIFDRRADRLPFAEDIAVGSAEDARIDEATGLDAIVLDFWQERFYAQVTIDNRQAAPDLARQTVVQFAEN
ncbi:MAG: hypothetical protein MUE60_14270, partial [Candidatus Eisenbacteria bacterium]|nr:hypothetical protein [Candidatus Eisenbacteria bacterium]